MGVESLASYRNWQVRVVNAWPTFQNIRTQRLAPEHRYGSAAEKVAENILADLFTTVLDWPLSDVNHQVKYADIVLTRLGIKHLIVEAKRPGALAWHEHAVEVALEQAHRYADEQKVRCVAVSDGLMLYACDHVPGGHRDRVFVKLDAPAPPLELYWLTVDGIYRERSGLEGAGRRLLPPTPDGKADPPPAGQRGPMHPKYHRPASCFAYVGNANQPSTWALPYRMPDGTVDAARLPKAIQAILSNYRGAHVGAVPETAIPDVLVTLGRAARRADKLRRLPASGPGGGPGGRGVYQLLYAALEQLGRLDEALEVSGGESDGSWRRA